MRVKYIIFILKFFFLFLVFDLLAFGTYFYGFLAQRVMWWSYIDMTSKACWWCNATFLRSCFLLFFCCFYFSCCCCVSFKSLHIVFRLNMWTKTVPLMPYVLSYWLKSRSLVFYITFACLALNIMPMLWICFVNMYMWYVISKWN